MDSGRWLKHVPVLLTLLGVLLMLAGFVFILQGTGVVGPQSSYMFDNPTWIYQGIAVMVIGILSLAGGLFLSREGH